MPSERRRYHCASRSVKGATPSAQFFSAADAHSRPGVVGVPHRASQGAPRRNEDEHASVGSGCGTLNIGEESRGVRASDDATPSEQRTAGQLARTPNQARA